MTARFIRERGILYLLSIGLLSTWCSAAIAICDDGPVAQNHQIGTNYLFSTNAKVYPTDGSGYSKYESCVYNPDKTNDLQVSWFVPGPRETWVLEGQTELSSRHQPDGASVPMEGCFQYGNLGETTLAEYMGSAGDAKAEKSDSEKACIQKAKGQKNAEEESGMQSNPLSSFADEFVVYFPSNPDNARNSMLKLVGSVGIEKTDEKFYLSTVNFNLSKVEGRPDGSVAGINIRPLFSGDAESLLKFYFKKNPSLLPIEKAKSIQFAVFGSGTWKLTSGRYEFLDASNKRLGSIEIPLFVPVLN